MAKSQCMAGIVQPNGNHWMGSRHLDEIFITGCTKKLSLPVQSVMKISLKWHFLFNDVGVKYRQPAMNKYELRLCSMSRNIDDRVRIHFGTIQTSVIAGKYIGQVWTHAPATKSMG